MWSSLVTLVVGLVHATDLDVILYGATGCLGHIAAGHLAKQTGLKWAIAGRNMTKLQYLASKLAKEGGPSSKPELIAASLDGKVDPGTWVRRARAVITSAGPFSVHNGELIAKACAKHGVHYSDTSDEFYWQRWMIDRHDATARASGARVVLSSGFCVLSGDLGSQLAIQKLAPDHGSKVSLDAWLEEYNGGVSAGVINTGKATKKARYPKIWDKDPYVLAPQSNESLRLDNSVEGMSYPSIVKGEGMVVSNMFGPYDARLLRRSFTQKGQRVQLRVGATPSVYSKWTAFLLRHPGSWSSLATCPTEQVLQGGSWAYRFRASEAGGKTKTVLLSGKGDPGYTFTAVGLAETGLCLAGKTSGCLKKVDKSTGGGVFTSTSAVDISSLRHRLESIGLLKVATEIESETSVFVI